MKKRNWTAIIEVDFSVNHDDCDSPAKMIEDANNYADAAARAISGSHNVHSSTVMKVKADE